MPRSPERFGIVVALPAEARSLTSKPLEIGDIVELGRFWLTVSGIGGRSAAEAAERLIARGADALLCWGTAGGLDPRLESGALLLPSQVVGDDTIEVDASWHHFLADRLNARMPVDTAALFTSHTPLAGSAEKAAAFATSGAAAVDMESGAVGSVARRHALPFAVIRAVVDPATLTLPQSALTSIDAAGRTSIWLAMKSLIVRPGDLLPLIDLGQRFSKAMRTLRRAAAIILEPNAAPTV